MYSDLDKKRNIADPVADALVQKLFNSGQISSMAGLMGYLSQKDNSFEKSSKEASIFFTRTQLLPDWVDLKSLKRGAVFFAKNSQLILSILGYYALPYCYAAADGCQVLYLSEKIRKNTTKRLIETGQFVLEVMNKNAFDSNGPGFLSCQKVRLTHAAVRFHILKSNQWNAEWGLPVNQEDMAGTNSAFSYISLRGLDKFGIQYTNEEAEDYLHLWKTIGYLLGVETDLLPDNLKQAYLLDKKIAARNFKKSEAGTELTKALIKSFEGFLPNSGMKSIIPSYLRFMLGEKIADLLDVPSVFSPVLDTIWFGSMKIKNAFGNILPQNTDATQVMHALALQMQRQNSTIPISE